MASGWRRRPIQPEPENGWVDWELVGGPPLPGAPADASCRLDLGSGRLITASPQRVPSNAAGTRTRPEGAAAEWIGVGLVQVGLNAHPSKDSQPTDGMRSLRGSLRVVSPLATSMAGESNRGPQELARLRGALGPSARWHGILDGTPNVGDWTRGRLEDGGPFEHVVDLLIPWMPGLWRETELACLGAWASSRGLAGVVPVAVDATPKQVRSFAERVALQDDRALRLFLQDGGDEALADHRAVLAESGVRWWFERIADHPLPRTERIRRVTGALGLLARLGEGRRSTGWVEGHRQAARRLEAEQIDVRDLLGEGNLRLLQWLDRRTASTLCEWFGRSTELDGEAPALEQLRAEAGQRVERPISTAGMADLDA